jgi:hypothetical protein
MIQIVFGAPLVRPDSTRSTESHINQSNKQYSREDESISCRDPPTPPIGLRAGRFAG